MPPLHNRAAILLFFLFLWAALVAAHLFYYSVIASDIYIKRGNAIAERKGVIKAHRGRIISHDGKILAWNETHIDICVENIPEFPFYRNKLERGIAKYFMNFTFPPDYSRNISIQRDISPLTQARLYPLVKRFPEVVFRERTERKYISEKLKPALTVIEKKYNAKLKGKDGIYNVMADRNGRWIPNTWKEKVKAVDGEDIIITIYDGEYQR